MTPIDDDPQPPGAAPQLLTVGSPQVGEVLAERYRLEEHIGDDSLGRQLWRGSDVILQRPVTVVLRYPGGNAASEMLSAAVAASRIVHPHLIGVYDAIDEGDRAYVVREWVQGTSLRDVVAGYGPLEADKAVAIGHAIAGAVAALHDTGMAHGNVQPGTVLIGDDGRVVLADARADESATVESDIRAVGAVLYCGLTGSWPHAEAGPTQEPDAMRDAGGVVAAPHQIRAGIPDRLDQLTSGLLTADQDLPSADELTAELARLDQAQDHRALFADDPVDFDAFDSAADAPRAATPTGRKMAMIIAALVVIAIIGTFAALQTLGGDTELPQAEPTGTAAPGRPPSGQVAQIKLDRSQLRIVDPQGNGTELDGAEKMVDGDRTSSWSTDRYPRAEFGGIKKGMGVLIDLGKETTVSAVDLQLSTAGATIELRAGATDPGPGRQNDATIVEKFQLIGQPRADVQSHVVMTGDPNQKVRYLLVWCTKLPPEGRGQHKLGVLELTILGE